MTANPDQPAPKASQHQSPDGQNTPHTIPYVVGIGASAGGLQAIITLLEHLPPDPGMALVIIQHLDPTRPSSLVEILGKKTDLPIEQVDEQTIIQPNHIYIIAPGHYLALADGYLEVTVPDTPRGSRMAINFFFESLAVNARERAIGVILSGTGTDGTVGLREIKQLGGLAVVQDPEEAAQPGMPQSALRAVDADYTLRAKDIGPRLKAYVDFHQQHALSPATTHLPRQTHAAKSEGVCAETHSRSNWHLQTAHRSGTPSAIPANAG